ncbi:ABC transporter substrate-binding protein [Rhodovastum atsumiense]|uniref:ABC transporter substrate-binding protein n=1 Tax=Rhodovastum atsumiense TaxID=504468 RepID=A0A5M6J1M7_9PROT|nr:ABC transporter substrate-binding protein [Rhodovastum atsumiense]KAA5613525.1 ABC transporter substrate-binding protein [Rhodovastum atsumiense]CAH2603275.1 ABC transporter substrate-binding protein [Rhodovastum atsumiense]
MPLRRNFLAGGLATLTAFPPLAARAAGGEPEVKELRYQGMASAVGYPELAENLGYLAPLRLRWVGNTISGPQDIQATVTGDTDFGQAFHSAILKLIGVGAPLVAVIGNTGTDAKSWSGLYTLEDSPVQGPRDLVGRKVGVNTYGAHNEFVLQEYLRRAGLAPAEIAQVTLVVLPPSNAEQALRLRQIDAVFLSPIFREKAASRGGIRLLQSDFELFGEFTTGSYVLTRRFIARNPNAARVFVSGTARAIEWAHTREPAEVVARLAEIIHRRNRGGEDDSAVRYWKSIALGAKGGVLADRNFTLFLDWFRANGNAAVARLKPAEVYTNAFNPYAEGTDRQG